MPFISLHEATDKIFDYVLVGGGTAGLTLAARLTEDPATTVLVLEAGESHLGDPLVDIPGTSFSQLGNPKYDWGFKTVPQKNINNREIIGKGLGGSSKINFGTWNVPPADDIDNWEKLGNPGWNFKNFEKYYKKVRSLTEDGRSFPKDISTITGAAGTDRSLENELSKCLARVKCVVPESTFLLGIISSYSPLTQTLHQLGFPKSLDPDNGKLMDIQPLGAYFTLSNLDPRTHQRSYAATAYYLPNETRPNFSVLLTAHVHRVVTSKDGDKVTATGVEFHYGSEVHLARAAKEVILCAGALKSPQILELSGIGRPEVLNSIGVPVIVALEGVGENVQEHNVLSTAYQAKDDSTEETYDMLQDPEYLAAAMALHPEGKGIFNTGTAISMAFVPLQTFSPHYQEIHQAEGDFIERSSDKYSKGLLDQYAIQLERLRTPGTSGGCEFAIFPGSMGALATAEAGKKYFSLATFSNHPFSRGSIHAISNDPSMDPAFDPHYFEHNFDLQIFVEMVKFTRKLAKTQPLSQILESGDSVNPPMSIQTDAELLDWVKGCISTTWHTTSSLSMLPLDKGGVVDPRLKVYGTSNIRVVDLSIVPLHFSGHSQVTAYVIGEIAADIIKGHF
ncbi:alcohol oxidase [Mycena floridula]|nr:alcohol oxidase [Mycena floridula]